MAVFVYPTVVYPEINAEQLSEQLSECIVKVDSLVRISLKEGVFSVEDTDAIHFLWVLSDYVQRIRLLNERLEQLHQQRYENPAMYEETVEA